MAIVIHEDEIKVLLKNKFYVLEGIETMIYAFWGTSIIYYDGTFIKIFNGEDSRILCMPEPGIINIQVVGDLKILLVYEDKMILDLEKVYNVRVSKNARVNIINHGCIVIYELDHTKIMKEDIIIIDHCVFNVSVDGDVIEYMILEDNIYRYYYDIITKQTTKKQFDYIITKFMDYEMAKYVDTTCYSLFYNKRFLTYTYNFDNLKYIDHNCFNILIHCGDDMMTNVIGGDYIYNKVTSDIQLYHKPTGLNTKSARKYN